MADLDENGGQEAKMMMLGFVHRSGAGSIAGGTQNPLPWLRMASGRWMERRQNSSLLDNKAYDE
jgi:hypothetical protein